MTFTTQELLIMNALFEKGVFGLLPPTDIHQLIRGFPESTPKSSYVSMAISRLRLKLRKHHVKINCSYGKGYFLEKDDYEFLGKLLKELKQHDKQ